eukprot:TRINITY_DN4947_c0_g2_i17.p1 TRINITY_DN4947_c0_g2~~TRINITY_DN4947_c0_g2_i17.p1  ORF type:complete len:190 (-),score=51.37 TRINITY_DN4947_c0_g2_i17:269-838(-)
MNTDLVAATSDAATEALAFLFQHPAGRTYLRERRGVPLEIVDQLSSLGYSSIANILAAIQTAKFYDLTAKDAIITVATDGARMYASEMPAVLDRRFGGEFDQISAAEAFGRYMLGVTTDHFLETTFKDRNRIFNLGYFTWVEQQGKSVEEFEARRKPGFWDELRPLMKIWDRQISEFNADVARPGASRL